jgi:hypothetical protein
MGWSVIEVATDRAASLDGVMLIGLSLDDAETLVSGFNALELRCTKLARKSVLGTATQPVRECSASVTVC